MSGIFGIGSSALLAYQRALSVTGHNIANAGNENYTRQRLELGVRNPQFGGAGWFGQGVQMTDVARIADQFVLSQLRDNTSGFGRHQVYYQYAQRADNMLADPLAGLSPVLDQFFAAVQDVSNDPTSIPARQVLLSQGRALADRFAFIQKGMDDQRRLLEGQVSAAVQDINSLAQGIANLNRQIVDATGIGGGKAPNDLLDQRDELVGRLAELVTVQTLPQDDGSVNILVGSGQSLVVGPQASTLSAQALGNDPTRMEIAMVSTGSTIRITELITGGQLGGLLEVRRDILDPAQNALGLTAVGLALAFNELHADGVDLDGLAGGEFFQVPAPGVLVGRGNVATGRPDISFTDAGALTGGDYRLSYDGSEWRLSRIGVPGLLATAAPGDTISIDGLDIDLSSITGQVAGDSFDLQPTRNAAAGFRMAMTDPRAFAAALPPDDPAASVAGDNRNALALAGLASQGVLAGGSTSISASYNQLVADVGVKTRQAQLSFQAQGRMLDESRAMRESISGVNLDEEAANLLRYQQAYSAAAQVIAVAGTMFDTLLMAVRR